MEAPYEWNHHLSKNHLLLSGTAGVEVLRSNGLQIYIMACSHRASEDFLCSAGRKIHPLHTEEMYFLTPATKQSRIALSKEVSAAISHHHTAFQSAPLPTHRTSVLHWQLLWHEIGNNRNVWLLNYISILVVPKCFYSKHVECSNAWYHGREEKQLFVFSRKFLSLEHLSNCPQIVFVLLMSGTHTALLNQGKIILNGR